MYRKAIVLVQHPPTERVMLPLDDTWQLTPVPAAANGLAFSPGVPVLVDSAPQLCFAPHAPPAHVPEDGVSACLISFYQGYAPHREEMILDQPSLSLLIIMSLCQTLSSK